MSKGMLIALIIWGVVFGGIVGYGIWLLMDLIRFWRDHE